MAGQSGANFLLKKGNGEVPNETFTLIAGMKTTGFVLRNSEVDASSYDSGAWRKLLEGAGKRYISISGAGYFTDSASEEQVRAWAFTAAVKNFQITFGNGDGLKGPFIVSYYERRGDMDNEELYAITLESAGEIAYTVG